MYNPEFVKSTKRTWVFDNENLSQENKDHIAWLFNSANTAGIFEIPYNDEIYTGTIIEQDWGYWDWLEN